MTCRDVLVRWSHAAGRLWVQPKAGAEMGIQNIVNAIFFCFVLNVCVCMCVILSSITMNWNLEIIYIEQEPWHPLFSESKECMYSVVNAYKISHINLRVQLMRRVAPEFCSFKWVFKKYIFISTLLGTYEIKKKNWGHSAYHWATAC